MSSPITIIDEAGLEDFRARALSPDALLELLGQRGRVLVRVPLGVGKSRAADSILATPEVYEAFELIVYVAPSWDILNERPMRNGANPLGVPYIDLEARPRGLCGDLDRRWTKIESTSCIAYGKRVICGTCPQLDGCTWPNRYSDALGGVRVVFCTEQHLVLNRSFVSFIKNVAQTSKVLMILDEARFIDTPFDLHIKEAELIRYRAALREAELPELLAAARAQWIESVDALLHADGDMSNVRLRFPAVLNKAASAIQEVGLTRYRFAFKFLGYDLVQLARSRPESRWKDESGSVRCTTPPDLGTHALILSANLDSGYVAHRLGIEGLASPFERLRVRHSGTRLYNLRSRLGAAAYFPKNQDQILDLFASLIARNVQMGKTTLLVSRKRFKASCAQGLSERLKELGMDVAFVSDDYGTLGPVSSRVIPIIHYGMAGINAFEDYEVCYCLNSYNIPEDVIDASLQDSAPVERRVSMGVQYDARGDRRMAILDRRHLFSGLDRVGDTYIRKLEIDPVLQAAGRVRFFTKPREVVFFQRHDLAPDVGEVVEIGTVAEAYRALGVPRFVELKRSIATNKLRSLMGDGKSLRAASLELGIDKQTASRWLKAERLNSPHIDNQRGVETSRQEEGDSDGA